MQATMQTTSRLRGRRPSRWLAAPRRRDRWIVVLHRLSWRARRWPGDEDLILWRSRDSGLHRRRT